jgi:hypothetical protein
MVPSAAKAGLSCSSTAGLKPRPFKTKKSQTLSVAPAPGGATLRMAILFVVERFVAIGPNSGSLHFARAPVRMTILWWLGGQDS